jgi:Cytochrome P460
MLNGFWRPPVRLAGALSLVLATAAAGIAAAAAAGAEWSTDGAVREATVSTEAGPSYESDGRLKMPAKYREWIFLSSGIDMSYGPTMAGHSMFDNVFVEPTAYREFVRTGRWPDGTSLVLEVRGASEKGSINKHGKFQTGDLMGLEVHVKDTKRFQGDWAFFSFSEGPGAAKMVPTSAACYSCHQQHAAVDTTFVQFYPTLLSIATVKGTLSPAYLSKEAGSEEAGRR